MRNEESNLQSLMVRWFDLVYSEYRLNLFAVPNGQNKSKIQAAKFKREGLRSGVSDLIFIFNGNTYFIEVKTPKGTQQKTQKDFEKVVNEHYFNYYLVRSLDEFQYIINNIIQELENK